MLDMENIKRDLKADLKPRKIIRAALIPQFKGISSPLRDVFGLFVQTIALLFVQGKLISKDHPSVTGELRGLGAIWQMIIDGSTQLEFKKEKVPQLMVFYCVIAMIVFSILAVFTLISGLLVGHAHAQTPTNIFQDSGTAFNWLNQLFPFSSNAGASPSDLPLILGSMLLIYNTGILVIASLFALWSLISMVVDSAHHGQWGGQRHSALYAPIRLVFAIGILTPLSAFNNYNTAQIMAVEIAHAGSGLANSVWTAFYTNLMNVTTQSAFMPGGDINTFAQQMFLDTVCIETYQNYTKEDSTIQTSANFGTATPAGSPTTAINPISVTIRPSGGARGGTTGTPVVSNYIVNFNKNSANGPAGDALCGSLNIPAVDMSTLPVPADAKTWLNETSKFYAAIQPYTQAIAKNAAVEANGGATTTVTIPWASLISTFQSNLDTDAQNLGSAYQTNNPNTKAMEDTAATDGWVDAGAVFLQIARLAHDISQLQQRKLAANLPSQDIMPTIQQMQDKDTGSSDCSWWAATFEGCTEAGQHVRGGLEQAYYSIKTAQASAGIQAPDVYGTTSASTDANSGILATILNATGISNILAYFNIANSTSVGSNSTTTFGQPIFNAVYFGNLLSLMDSGLFITAMGSGVSIMGFSAGPGFAQVLTFFGAIFYPVALMFSVYLPLMPAMRFLFGILTWLLSIFEALLGLPVVALWHLRSDGEGLFAHGQQGYLMLLQMMLRPTLMVFGLLGAVMVFDTLFNFISYTVFGTWWSLVDVQNHPIASFGELLPFFGFLMFYSFMVYNVANVSFNLINQIPDRILGWIGSGLSIGTNTGADDAIGMARQQGEPGLRNSTRNLGGYAALSAQSYQLPQRDNAGNIQYKTNSNGSYETDGNGQRIPVLGDEKGSYTGQEKMALLSGTNISPFSDNSGNQLGGGGIYKGSTEGLGASGGTSNPPAGSAGSNSGPNPTGGNAGSNPPGSSPFSGNGFGNGGYGAINTTVGYSGPGPGGGGIAQGSGQALGQSFQTFGSSNGYSNNIPAQPGAEVAPAAPSNPKQNMADAFARLTPSVEEQSPGAAAANLDAQVKQDDISLNAEATKDSSEISEEKSEAMQQIAAAKSSINNGEGNTELNSPSAPVVGGLDAVYNGRINALRQRFLDIDNKERDRGDDELER